MDGPTQQIEHLAESEKDDENAPHPWGKLISLSTKHSNIDLLKDEYTFGRGSTCDCVFQDLGVSGKHCRIFRERIGNATHDHLVWIEDSSTNGTFINNEAVGKGKKKLLENGVTLSILNKSKTNNDENVSFIYQDCHEEQQELEEGGPQKKYEMREVLGTGNFATVKLGIHKETGEKFAIKIIDKKKFLMSKATKRKNALLGEVEILKKINHPGCIGITEMFETPEKLYLILELVTGGELFDKIVEAGSFTEEKTREYLIQMLDAVKYLHEQGIAHRDLKPENILLKSKEEDKIKLSDFGLSRVMDGASMMKTMCGTPQYVAPEILTSAGEDKSGYSKACDLWSLGVILYIMLVGYPPFHENKSAPLFQQIKTADYDFPEDHWSGISEEAKDLINHLLIVDPSTRYTVEQALAHPWCKGEKLPAGQTAASNKAALLSNSKKGSASSKKTTAHTNTKANDNKNSEKEDMDAAEEEEEEEEENNSKKRKAASQKSNKETAAKKRKTNGAAKKK